MTSNSLVNSILGPTMNDYSCTDFSATIKGEIERDVARLIDRCWDRLDEFQADDWFIDGYDDDIGPKYIELGYLINSHHGRDLYKEGDLICGLPVRIDRDNTRSITVSMGIVGFFRDSLGDDDDDEDVYTEAEDHRVEASTTW